MTSSVQIRCLTCMLLTLCFTYSLQGQDSPLSSGIIKYETNRKAQIGAAGQQFTQTLNIKTTYHFLKDKAGYEAVMMGGIKINVFVKSKTQEQYQALDYQGKSYAVIIPSKGEVLKLMPDDTQEILGYTCKKALVKYDDKEAEVYYTEQIPYDHSPVGNFDLGGAILAFKSEEIEAKATSIVSSDISDKEVTLSEGRKKITMEERKALFAR